MKRGITRILLSVVAGLMLLGMSVMAEGESLVTRTIKLSVGKADTVTLPRPVADVLVANPGVADVGTLRSDRLYIVGRAVGDTNVLAFDDEGNQLANISIQVRVDEETLSGTVREFFPNEQVEVRTVNNSIVLKGRVSTPSVANQVRDLVGRFVPAQGQTLVDLMTVRGEQQVMLKVRVLEAKRQVLREVGVDTTLTLGNGSRNNFTLTPSGGTGLTADPFGAGVLAIGQLGRFGPLESNLSGLERDGLVNTLAEPTLTAISGETAGFLAGGEFPVPSGRDTSGNVTVEFRQFGVALNFIPTVLSNDKISLQLTSEVSERSDADGVTLAGIVVPGLTIRRAQTTVQMASGGTLMMAGLLKSNTVDAVNGFPGLKDLPVIGNLFKSKSFQRGESELVFLVTPYIVEPYAEAQAERVATASPYPDNIVTTSHGVSLRDAVSHEEGSVPAAAGVYTSDPAPTPAGVPARTVPTRGRHSESGFDANRVIPARRAAAPARLSAAQLAAVTEPAVPAPKAAPVEKVSATPLKAAPKAAAAAVTKDEKPKAREAIAVPAAAPVLAVPKEVAAAPVTVAKALTSAMAAPKAPVTASKEAKSEAKEAAVTAAIPVRKVAAAPAPKEAKTAVGSAVKAAVRETIAAPAPSTAAPVQKKTAIAAPSKAVKQPIAAKPAAKQAAAGKESALKKAAAAKAASPLSESFMGNMKKLNGGKAPAIKTSEATYGYIVN